MARLLWIGLAIVVLAAIANELEQGTFKAPQHDPMHDFGKLGTDWVEVLPNFELAPKPDLVKRDERLAKSSERLWDVQYGITASRWRNVPVTGRKRKSHHAIFLGDAMTFGMGVHDSETIPYFFSERARDHRSYNRGFIGYAPNDLLARMREKEGFWEGISEKDGVAYYLLSRDHLLRVAGSASAIRRGGAGHPYFREEPDGRLVQDGNFEKGRPLLTGLLKTVGRLDLLRILGVDWGVIPARDRWPLLVRLVREMKREYTSRFPRGRFHVVLMPDTTGTFSTVKVTAETGAPAIDLAGGMPGESPLPTVRPDIPVFLPAANRVIADRIWNSTSW